MKIIIDTIMPYFKKHKFVHTSILKKYRCFNIVSFRWEANIIPTFERLTGIGFIRKRS